MEPISIALGLAKFIPDVIGLFDKKRGDKAKEAISRVSDIAESLTGEKGDSAIKMIEQDPNLALEFKKAVMEDAHVKDQMDLENIKSARNMYSGQSEQADKIATSVIRYNLIIVALLLSLDVVVMILLQDKPVILAMIATLFGGVMQSLISERQAVIGFFFGSSLGSKLKDAKQK